MRASKLKLGGSDRRLPIPSDPSKQQLHPNAFPPAFPSSENRPSFKSTATIKSLLGQDWTHPRWSSPPSFPTPPSENVASFLHLEKHRHSVLSFMRSAQFGDVVSLPPFPSPQVVKDLNPTSQLPLFPAPAPSQAPVVVVDILDSDFVEVVSRPPPPPTNPLAAAAAAAAARIKPPPPKRAKVAFADGGRAAASAKTTARFVRIVTDRGANVRSSVSIDDSEVLGTLEQYQEVELLGEELLLADDDEVIDIVRLQIRFVRDGLRLTGWISDRGRLKSDPYLIAQKL